MDCPIVDAHAISEHVLIVHLHSSRALSYPEEAVPWPGQDNWDYWDISNSTSYRIHYSSSIHYIISWTYTTFTQAYTTLKHPSAHPSYFRREAWPGELGELITRWRYVRCLRRFILLSTLPLHTSMHGLESPNTFLLHQHQLRWSSSWHSPFLPYLNALDIIPSTTPPLIMSHLMFNLRVTRT